jgi:hypothetical protein
LDDLRTPTRHGSGIKRKETQGLMPGWSLQFFKSHHFCSASRASRVKYIPPSIQKQLAQKQSKTTMIGFMVLLGLNIRDSSLWIKTNHPYQSLSFVHKPHVLFV